MGGFNRNKYIFSSTPAIVDISSKTVNLREQQISWLVEELFLYKVLLRDLVSHCPSYRDRNLILNISQFILDEFEIFDTFQSKKELPMAMLSLKTRISKSFIETWQDYIIAYVLILNNPRYKNIQDYIRIEIVENSKAISVYKEKNIEEHKGIALKKIKGSTIILTSAGEFLKIKNTQCRVGEEVRGEEKKGFRHYKLQISIATLLIILGVLGGVFEYSKTVTIVMIKTTSEIKYELNRFNKVVYTYSPSEKGNNLLNYVDPLDDSIDYALKNTIEYAKGNEMIPQDGIVVTISGKPLKYGIFKETGEYIVQENIRVLINNAGSQHKLYESTIRQKEENNEQKEK